MDKNMNVILHKYFYFDSLKGTGVTIVNKILYIELSSEYYWTQLGDK